MEVGEEGFRFKPSDEQKLEYLLRFVGTGYMGDAGLIATNVNVYGDQEPWEIYPQGVPCNGEDIDDWTICRCFITKLKIKSAKMYIRTVGTGNWKQEDKGKAVVWELGSKVIGYKKSLSYKKKKNHDPQIYGHWLMEEYELSEEVIWKKFKDPERKGWVLCAIKMKKPSSDHEFSVPRMTVDNSVMSHDSVYVDSVYTAAPVYLNEQNLETREASVMSHDSVCVGSALMYLNYQNLETGEPANYQETSLMMPNDTGTVPPQVDACSTDVLDNNCAATILADDSISPAAVATPMDDVETTEFVKQLQDFITDDSDESMYRLSAEIMPPQSYQLEDSISLRATTVDNSTATLLADDLISAAGGIPANDEYLQWLETGEASEFLTEAEEVWLHDESTYTSSSEMGIWSTDASLGCLSY